RPGGGRAWGWVLDRVLRRPAVSVVVSAGVLLVLALPALQMKTVVPGAEAFPKNLEPVKVYNRLEAAFPGEPAPAVVVVTPPSLDDPRVQRAIRELRTLALASGQFHQPVTVAVNRARTVARIELPIAGSGSNAVSYAALSALRSDIVPQTVGSLGFAEAGVTGDTAISKDFGDSMHRSAPLVFPFVLALAFVLLLAAFRSIVIAVKAIVLNLLSVAAAFGVLVLVFQHDWAKGILGFDYSGGVMAWLPI